MTIEISDLRQRPEFFDALVDRVWRAWWEPRGFPRSYIATRAQENLNAESVPFALVAHDGDTFAGTASVIVDDLDERPLYTPWVAAVWVEPEFRSKGVGRALVTRAATDTFAAGFKRIYLNALPARSSFYGELGWMRIEESVGQAGVTVFIRLAEFRDAI